MDIVQATLAWAIDQLRQQPVLLLFTLLTLGYVIGRISVKGFTLGPVAGVLFAGILFGHEGLRISDGAQAVGFALFIFAVGYQAGPRFFSALKADGLKYFLLSAVVAVSAVVAALTAASLLGLKPGVSAGLLAGGLTSSPTLAAAQDAVREASISLPAGYSADDVIGNIASAYAITYIFGLTGLITLIRYLPKLLKIDLEAECRALESLSIEKTQPVNITTRRYRVENAEFTVLTLTDLRNKYFSRAPIATIVRDGKNVAFKGQDYLQIGDLLELVAPQELFSKELKEIGPELPLDRDIHENQETRIVVVTSDHARGKTLFELNIPHAFHAIIQKIVRQRVELPHHPQLELKKGDILYVVGSRDSLNSLGAFMGYIERDPHQTDMLTFAIGISAGALIGMLSFHLGGLEVGLGNAGGLLTAGLLVGYLHSIRPNFGALPVATSWWLMEFGLLLFMAGVGLHAGSSFFSTLLHAGPLLIVAGLLITLVPILTAYVIGSRVLKLNPAILMGALTGAMTSGASLSVVTAEAKSSIPAIGYAGTYAFGNVLLMIAGPAMLLLG